MRQSRQLTSTIIAIRMISALLEHGITFTISKAAIAASPSCKLCSFILSG
jgi:hypothetical protein